MESSTPPTDVDPEVPIWWSVQDQDHLLEWYEDYHPQNSIPTPSEDGSSSEEKPASAEPPWYSKLGQLPTLFQGRLANVDREAIEIAARVLCQAISIPGDCKRSLLYAEDEHRLSIFTNQRVIQFYCTHWQEEHPLIDNLLVDDHISRNHNPYRLLQYLTYEDFTKKSFEDAKPFLALECLYPVGLDMAALSPLDINVNLKSKSAGLASKMTEKKTTAAAPAMGAKQARPSREKDHPPPPPPFVQEPPSKGRPTGAVYETGRLLGKGGFAICHEGRRQGGKEIFALKIVKSQMPQKKMEQKFQTELQIHSKMHHPNIVEFCRAFTYEESTYIILELCPNGSLMDMVKKRRFITEPEVRFYTIQIAGAIKYMHSKGIIHRDLKMGNIFLDKDMNVKIGDFGLAALLISGKDMATVRRTTLCGTPNYIAPEILEKGKKGHDHAVDIWSLGIIIFAMLTGRPPFQSPTQDEIYRKARERDYDWPAMDKSDNYICQEAKDLVATMLQPADQRPDCDTIVQHPFFSCGWVPTVTEMVPRLKDSPPDPSMFAATGLRGGRANLYARNLKALCITSGVGPWCEQEGEYVEGQVKLSVYNEMRSEQKYGLTPDIPLATGIVYRPFDEAIIDVKADRAARQAEAARANQRMGLDDSSLAYRPAANRIPQSFAAQQRAQHPGSAQKPREAAPTVMAPPRRPRAQAPEPEATPTKTRTRSDVGATGYNAGSENEAATTSAMQRGNHAQPESANPTTSRSTRGMGGIISGAPRRAAIRTQSEEKQERELAVERRLGEELAKDLAEPKGEDEEPAPPPAKESMFSPWEKIELLPNSTPDDVLRRLERFQAEIQRALNSRSLGTVQKPEKEHHLVVKWVDYTNKYGLGYILNDGSVGCIFKALPIEAESDKFTPPSAIIVRHGEQHLLHRENKQYADKDQLIPIIEGKEVEFYENKGEAGQYVSRVPAKQFKASVAPGRAMRLQRGKDEWDDRKREKLVIWKKFANYMTVFGRDEEHPRDEAVGRIDASPSNGMVVTFYQRLGDVGIWGFYDGSFQFNFPDHTKLVLSSDGSWCDFYHLPLEAARDLAEKGSIPPAALDDRQCLSYSVQAFLNFMRVPSSSSRTRTNNVPSTIDPMIQGIPSANDFRRKIQFVNSVVSEWIENGGIGASAMNPTNRLRWSGYRECVSVKSPYKCVWVTVGGVRGDERRVAWFDPREPGKIMPDIEAPRS